MIRTLLWAGVSYSRDGRVLAMPRYGAARAVGLRPEPLRVSAFGSIPIAGA
jgi:hypothetical protein